MRKNAGFTLIELLIVISIVSVGASIMLVTFGNNQIRRELEGNAREVVGLVREAQNNALTGKQTVAATTPCRYQVSWSGSGYSMTYWYKNASELCTQTSPVSSYVLKNGVAFSGADNFYFTLPHATLNFGSGSMAIVLTKQGISRVVCVYATGLINELDGSTCP